MSQVTRFSCSTLVLAGAIGMLACSDAATVVAPSHAPAVAIMDAAHGWEAHFFWLPPISPTMAYPGTFDGDLSPEVRVCGLAAGVCTGQPTVFSAATSPTVRVDTRIQAYSLPWQANTALG